MYAVIHDNYSYANIYIFWILKYKIKHENLETCYK